MRKQLVLAIDDESETLELIQEVLGGSYDVWAFQNPRKGLAKAISTPPDLLLLDIDMPGLNGFQICEKFRAAHPRRPTPVIFLTSDMEASSMQRALKAGANDYLIKPFRIADLLGRIRFRLGQVELALVLCLGNLTLDPSWQTDDPPDSRRLSNSADFSTEPGKSRAARGTSEFPSRRNSLS